MRCLFLRVQVEHSLRCRRGEFDPVRPNVNGHASRVLLYFEEANAALRDDGRYLAYFLATVEDRHADNKATRQLVIRVEDRCVCAFIFPRRLGLTSGGHFYFALIRRFRDLRVDLYDRWPNVLLPFHRSVVHGAARDMISVYIATFTQDVCRICRRRGAFFTDEARVAGRFVMHHLFHHERLDRRVNDNHFNHAINQDLHRRRTSTGRRNDC